MWPFFIYHKHTKIRSSILVLTCQIVYRHTDYGILNWENQAHIEPVKLGLWLCKNILFGMYINQHESLGILHIIGKILKIMKMFNFEGQYAATLFSVSQFSTFALFLLKHLPYRQIYHKLAASMSTDSCMPRIWLHKSAFIIL